MEKLIPIFLAQFLPLISSQDFNLILQTRSGYLQKYESFASTRVMHFTIPQDTSMASFKFRASEMKYSIFGCETQDVVLYVTRGSLPVINPEGFKFPKDYYLSGKPTLHHLEFTNDKSFKYLNLSTPVPGSYYAVAFHPYSNPQNEGITQDGLMPECHTYIDAKVYVKAGENVEFIMQDKEIKTSLAVSESKIYKLYVPDNTEHIIIQFKDVKLCETCSKLVGRVSPFNIPTTNSSETFSIEKSTEGEKFNYKLRVTENSFLYILFDAESEDGGNGTTEFIFHLEIIETKSKTNLENFLNAVTKVQTVNTLNLQLPFKQYDLHKSITAESFLFTYEMQPLKGGSVPITVNVTSQDFSVLKFNIKDILDVGGSLQVILAFKPRIVKNGRIIFRDKEPQNHTIIACLSNMEKQVPLWPNLCQQEDSVTPSPIILNKTNDNESIFVPFPESGDWYLSFRLFCGQCLPCDCSESCKTILRNCTEACPINENYGVCIEACQKAFIEGDCKGCDCVGGCKREETECNTTVVFDVSSYPCIGQDCGPNGKCALIVSEGLVYSSCLCTNKYKGWDCSDGSDANSMGMIILELVLLVLSNILFLPAVYVAYKKTYYVQMVVYFAIWLSSSLYHACDAGENIISFCIVRLSVLQFCDFYCALLAIWVSLVAIAYIPEPISSVLYIAGAIVLGAGTTLDKTSIWVFLIPVTCGIIIILMRWGLFYYQHRVLIPNRRYLKISLPCGFVVVLAALLAFSVFQTQSNYKFVHSLWHALMAIAIIILLPDKRSFSTNIS